MKKKYKVGGMTCSACSARVERAVSSLDCISEVSVNLLTGTMLAECKTEDAAEANELIINAVKDAGYEIEPFENISAVNTKQTSNSREASDSNTNDSSVKKRLIISFSFLIPLLYVSMGHMLKLPLPPFLQGYENSHAFAFVQLLLTLPIIAVNSAYYKKGFRALFKLSPNMDSLIALGSGAALIYGIAAIFAIGYGLGHNDTALVKRFSADLYFESAAMILTLITLGKFIEAKSKRKTTGALTKLIDFAPKTATVIRNEEEITIPASELIIGDIVVVVAGQSVPADGVIIEGGGAFDCSAITGESMPVDSSPGDRLPASAINTNGYIKLRAEKVGNETTISEIIRLMDEAASTKAPIARMADKISGWFVPFVISASLITAIVWLLTGAPLEKALYSMIAVMIISCPCALGLATPVAIMAGTGRAASDGILIKSASALEALHNIKAVLFDKTGTLTEGKPQIKEIFTVSGSEKELLETAYFLEKQSAHPIAKAVAEYYEQSGFNSAALPEITDFTEKAGRGVSAKLDETEIIAGNAAYMAEKNIDISAAIEKLSAHPEYTPLYISSGNKLLGLICVADTLKTGAVEAVSELKSLGIHTVMLTGDSKGAAEHVKKIVGVDEAAAELLPQDKEEFVKSAEANNVRCAMVGDGINDAPSLARATVGIAIGNGTEIAIDAADIVLMQSNPNSVVKAVKLSRRVMRIIKQNLFWAFFYNVLCIPIAAGVLVPFGGMQLSPMLAAAAMSFSSIFVVLNAARIFKAQKSK